MTAPSPIHRDEVPSLVEHACLRARPHAPSLGTPPLGRVGLEAETFPVRVSPDGTPGGRVPLSEIVPALAAVGIRDEATPGVPSFGLPEPGGGRLTLEPGGQVEHATPPHATAAAALRDVAGRADLLLREFQARDVALASIGLDPWHPAHTVRQQLRAPRYPAMSAYFAARGPAGHRMMVATCSLQVNLDLGPPDIASQRWLVATLAAPLLVATFSTSPLPDASAGRTLTWLAADPTRVGVPRLRPGDDPLDVLVDAALKADVLLVRRGGHCLPGRPGWTFGHWVAAGHPDFGRPTADDLTYHLTTLFPEVRARGFLEIRSCDALPAKWRAVPVVLLCGLLYDDVARGKVRDVLARHGPHLPELLARAAVSGVADPQLCALAVETWSFALAGAARLPTGYVERGHLAQCEAFLDRFTLRGRGLGDDLRAMLQRSPAAALSWAAEPGPLQPTFAS